MTTTEKSPPTPPPSSRTHARRWPWIVLIIILVLVLFVGIALITHRHSEASASGKMGAGQAVMVSTAMAQTGDMGVYVNALGIVTPVYTVSLEARVAGQITKVFYQEGQHVKIGDPLVEIDPAPYQAAVLQAQGQLEHDAALLKDAKLDLERYSEAYQSNAIPKQQYDTQVATVEQDEGTVKVDQGNLDNAKINLAYSHITSPIDGRVGLRLIDPGNIVQANGTTPLAVITQLQPITVIFNVAEDDLEKIIPAVHKQKDLTMEIYDREDQNKITTGKLETLDNEINTSTGTLKLRGVCSNEDESLFPSQFVNVHLLVNTLHDITLLPNSAIQRNSDSAYVYLVKSPEDGGTNQTVQIQTITTGVTDGTNSVVEGIDSGAVMASDNFSRLTDSAKITVRPAGGQGQRTGHKKDSQ